MAGTVEIPITSEGMMSLKQACQILITAYKKHSASILVDDENGIYPILLVDVKGLKGDVNASLDTIGSYDELCIDDIERPKNDELSSYKDIENIKGNYPISRDTYDGAKEELNDIFKGMKQRSSNSDDVVEGGRFEAQAYMNKKASDLPSSTKYQTLSTKKESELIKNLEGGVSDERDRINKFVKEDLDRKKIDEGIDNTVSGFQYLGSEIDRVASNNLNKTWQRHTKGKFKDIIRNECIPCDLRLHGLDELKPGLELLGVFEDMLQRYRDIVEKLKGLLTNTEIEDDICSLLEFLNFHCVPDLYSIIALFTALMQKYADILPNADGIFLQFIGPFFSPLLNGMSGILDRYIQIIMRPIDCVLDSIDTQLQKLDIQRALNKADVRKVAETRKKEGYLRRKVEALKERRSYLKGLLSDPSINENSAPPTQIGGLPRSSNSNWARNVLEKDPSTSRAASFNPQIGFVTIKEEIANLDADINDLEGKWRNAETEVNEAIKESGNTKGGVRLFRDDIRGFRNTLNSSLYELRAQILNGRKMMNDTLSMMKGELQRLIMGRAATSEELMEGAANIQRIARMIGIVKLLIKLAKNGKLCENSNNDPSVALGSFLSTNPNTGNNTTYFIGTNKNGEQSILPIPSGTRLELEDESGIKQTYEADEAAQFNKDGIAKDVGDIANKRITAVSDDLGVQVTVPIVEFSLCRDSKFSTEADIKKIQNWAKNAGLST